ncbi:diaminobutyrate--2-oxoglutarate transaminase [Plantactinospora sp. S1510]|uniref:Diaminobutyrate--2-oxoglutarate transaminase n=1 Tax=Plantactinospora alkalitolerans TaxID=2789879 RepID=A0ABS0GYF9_9ACTN|nr:diaminobutyrate--2-oxoglutarate transaminase [Plantactinospora alkalitolerans]MBF9131248.1 diaminobutyrate--2-oxoglutarate transaminase [Plantactinospora alkalitolerans]
MTVRGAADQNDILIVERRESAVRSYCRRFDCVLDTAEGSVVRDVSGREYLDFVAGAGSLNYGHNDPDMRAALIAHLEHGGLSHSLDLASTAKSAFLTAFESLVLLPRGLDHRVQFTGPTGANAVEAALKLARKVTGRSNVIAFTNGFHGMSQGALAATGNRHHRIGPQMPLHGVTRLPYDGYQGEGVDTADLLARMLCDPSSGLDAPAAILLETVQGEGGLNVASPGWLGRIAELARSSGALLVVDDVQAGCGRTGTFFSFEPFGIVPDLVVLSKSISGYGLPMALLLIRPEHDVWLPGEHNGTFRGNVHAFVTATVALTKFWAAPGFAADVTRRGDLLAGRLAGMARVVPGATVKGRGMMRGVDVGSGALAADITRRCFAGGLMLETSGPHDEVVKVLAPLTTPDDLLNDGLDILLDAARDVTTGSGVPGASGLVNA